MRYSDWPRAKKFHDLCGTRLAKKGRSTNSKLKQVKAWAAPPKEHNACVFPNPIRGKRR